MPAHDWTRVFPGTFHAFHSSWITHLAESLNNGLLPDDYYALPEQHIQQMIPDVLTLSASGVEWSPRTRLAQEPPSGTTAVADKPPQVSVHMLPDEDTAYRMARRTLVIRHRTGRRIVAMIEIISPGNKDSSKHLEQFLDKSVAAMQMGIHLLVVDLHPPGTWDPRGIHAAIWHIVGGGAFSPPEDKQLTLAAYQADQLPEAFVEPLAVGDVLKDMPLFLSVGWYVDVPLEATYMTAYAGLPSIVRDTVDGLVPSEWEQG